MAGITLFLLFYHVRPGETVTIEAKDASDGQITPESTVADILNEDPERANPTTGPLYVEGAKPGDAISVTFIEYAPSGWGWTGNIPGFGLLTDQFPEAALTLWKYEKNGSGTTLFGENAHIPVRPFTGTLGNAQATPGTHSVIPPYNVGGNMDIKDMVTGSTVYLPVEVEGALFSLGDTHAAQGDGEVCGTAIESPMNVTAKFDVVKQANLKFPKFEMPGNLHQRNLSHYKATTGIGPDLLQAAKDAVTGMIDLLGKEQKLDPMDAYMLCSVCGDLRINEIVDLPNYVVSFYFPFSVFK